MQQNLVVDNPEPELSVPDYNSNNTEVLVVAMLENILEYLPFKSIKKLSLVSKNVREQVTASYAVCAVDGSPRPPVGLFLSVARAQEFTCRHCRIQTVSFRDSSSRFEFVRLLFACKRYTSSLTMICAVCYDGWLEIIKESNRIIWKLPPLDILASPLLSLMGRVRYGAVLKVLRNWKNLPETLTSRVSKQQAFMLLCLYPDTSRELWVLASFVFLSVFSSISFPFLFPFPFRRVVIIIAQPHERAPQLLATCGSWRSMRPVRLRGSAPSLPVLPVRRDGLWLSLDSRKTEGRRWRGVSESAECGVSSCATIVSG